MIETNLTQNIAFKFRRSSIIMSIRIKFSKFANTILTFIISVDITWILILILKISLTLSDGSKLSQNKFPFIQKLLLFDFIFQNLIIKIDCGHFYIIIDYYYYLHISFILAMKNMFDALPGSDQEEEYIPVGDKSNKNAPIQKKKHVTSKPPIRTEEIPNKNQQVPFRIKEDAHQIRSKRQPKPDKTIADHRLHDRRSGTGRISQPRKNAGGAGGIGNVKDQLNQQKIFSKVKEQTTEQTNQEADKTIPPKEPQIPVLTLQEYYQKQGISLVQVDKKTDKNTQKKGPIEAEWVKKEKLTVLKTKEDIQIEDQDRRVAVVKESSHKIASQPEQELLGFKSSLTEGRKPRQNRETKQHQQKDYRDKPRQGRENRDARTNKKSEQTKVPKLVVNEQDFPSL